MKNFVRYVVPTMAILLVVFGIAIAANQQSWYSTTLPASASCAIDTNANLNFTGTAAVNFNGFFSTSTPGTPLAVTAGTVTVAEPLSGTAWKKVIYGLTAFTGSASTTYSYPIAFTQAPLVVNTMSAGSIGTFTNGLTGGTIGVSASAATGYISLEGK